MTSGQELDQAFHLDGFRDYLGFEAGNSPHTVDNYLRDLRRLAQFAVTRKIASPAGISRPLLRDFVYALKDLGLSGATIRRQVSAVRTYFGFLIGEELVESDPSDRLEMPQRGRKLPDTLTVQDIEALLAAPRAEEPLAWRDRALLELGYGAGLRVSELCGLTVKGLWL